MTVAGIHRVVIHQPGEGRPIDMGAFGMTVKVEAGDTGGGLSILEADEPAGFGPPMHIHRDAGEAFYVVSGEYAIFVEDEEHICGAGSFIYIPPGVTHGFRVGATPSRKLNIYVPAAMTGYFDELADAHRLDMPLDATRLGELADRHGMQVIGDLPEGYH
jgi:quercetin dioxygenase-like cupin family protein